MRTPDPTPAGFTRRLVATLLDGLIVVLVAGTTWSMMIHLFDRETIDVVIGHRHTRFLASGIIAAIIYVLYCWVRLQGTPGKLLMRCRIIDARSGSAPRLPQAFIRLTCYLLSALPVGLGFLWIIRDRRCRALHDKLAGTEVVMDDESTRTLEQLARELR